MGTPGALPEATKLVFRDEVWLKNIDYEHIPFICDKFHDHAHTFRGFPQNFSQQTNTQTQMKVDEQGFTKVTPKSRSNQKIKGKRVNNIHPTKISSSLIKGTRRTNFRTCQGRK